MNIGLNYFAAPGLMTSPGEQAHLLDGLPSDAASLCRIVQGLIIHIFWAERYGVRLAEPRRDEIQIRSFAEKLEHIIALDPRPLSEARPPEKRLVGNCRDFSVMLTGLLRHQGIPARARCGFGRYFMPEHFEDHWVCEYWHDREGRWVLLDPQLDEFQVGVLGVSFSSLDVPRNEFIVAGRAWEMCRSGEADPDQFGIADMHGLWFIRGNLGRDVASLNKVELLPWDGWGIIDVPDEQLSAVDLEALDRIARLTDEDVPDLDQVRALYESDERWRVPATIHSYGPKGARTITLAAA
jgi:hypothetical protein